MANRVTTPNKEKPDIVTNTSVYTRLSNLESNVSVLPTQVNLGLKADKTDVGDKTQLTTTDKTSLVNAINENVSHLADIVYFPLKYSGIGTGQNIPISTAFPSVKLTDVQALNPTATLSDSADWYVLQKLISDATTNKWTKLSIPNGTYIMSKTLDLTQKLGTGWSIECTGAVLKAATGFTSTLLTMSRGQNYGQCRNGHINGLSLDGNYTASVGIRLNDVHEFYLENVRLYRCLVGIHLTDCYYGEISGETVIQSCLTGVKTTGNTSNEVNTVDFHNTKINFADTKTNFIPKNTGESDADYNIRVISIGIELWTLIKGCKFYGITLEGMDYGYYGSKVTSAGTSFFTIDKNYFEAIKNQNIYLTTFSGYSNVVFTVDIINCRTSGITSTLAGGVFRLFGNEDFPLTVQKIGYRTTVFTNMSKDLITSGDLADTNLTIFSDNIAQSGNAIKYEDYGNVNTYPSSKNHLPTIQDYLFVEHTPRIRSGNRTRNPIALSVQTKPITFVPNTDDFAAPVIKGTDGNFYMMGTKDGTALTLTKVSNLYRLDHPVGAKTAKELYKMTGINEGTVYWCTDIQSNVTYKSSTGKWVLNYGQTNERIAIGKGVDFAGQTPISGSWFSPQVWNVQINSGYNGQSDFWGWGYDWFGNNRNNTRAVGTLAQRPANPNLDGFIYYSSDENKYYQWSQSGATWNAYTPIF